MYTVVIKYTHLLSKILVCDQKYSFVLKNNQTVLKNVCWEAKNIATLVEDLTAFCPTRFNEYTV